MVNISAHQLLPRAHKNPLNSSEPQETSGRSLTGLGFGLGLGLNLVAQCYLQDVDHDGDQELQDDERAQEVEAPEEDARGDLVPHGGRHVQQRLVHLHHRRLKP
jgi:hypothetical protein